MNGVIHIFLTKTFTTLNFKKNIDSICFYSDELFFLYKSKIIDIYAHEATSRAIFHKESIPLDSILMSNIDSIKQIPFYKKAFISYQKVNKYINFT
jgi:predicted ATP-dependent protease